MLACLIDGKGKVCVDDVPIPNVGHGEVLVKLAVAGICGTDVEKAHGGYGPGGILGHEVSGTIERIGEGVAGLVEGENVLAHHHVPCYNCHYCLRGDHTMCDLFKKTNFDPCGLAEFFRVPEANAARGAVIRLPSRVSLEEAAMIEPTACCTRALEKARVRPDEGVLVAGLGPTGLTQVQLLNKIGSSPIIGADPLTPRLEMARQFGASEIINTSTTDLSKTVMESTGVGVDLAIVSTGNPKAILPALKAVRRGGRVLLFGAPSYGSTIELDVSSLFGRQVSVVTSYSCIESDIHHVIELLLRGEIDLHSMVTDWFTLGEAPRAIDHARTSHAAIKTMIRS